MQKFDGNIVVFDLLETYHELGDYSFKIVLNPKLFKNSHDVSVSMLDADNNEIELDVRYWGRKLSCSFEIDRSTPDGVCVINVDAVTDKGKTVSEKLRCWVIK